MHKEIFTKLLTQNSAAYESIYMCRTLITLSQAIKKLIKYLNSLNIWTLCKYKYHWWVRNNSMADSRCNASHIIHIRARNTVVLSVFKLWWLIGLWNTWNCSKKCEERENIYFGSWKGRMMRFRKWNLTPREEISWERQPACLWVYWSLHVFLHAPGKRPADRQIEYESKTGWHDPFFLSLCYLQTWTPTRLSLPRVGRRRMSGRGLRSKIQNNEGGIGGREITAK